MWKWSNGAKILIGGGGPSYILNKTILTQSYLFFQNKLKITPNCVDVYEHSKL